jgi:hypothetical protein
MKIRVTIFLIFFSILGYSQVKDTVFFLNKSMMIGEFKKMKLGKIEFDSDEVGIVYIKYHKVKTMHVASYYCRTETIDKRVLYGSILASKTPGNIVVHTLKADVEVKMIDISSISFYGENWTDSLSGSFGAGYSYTKSSDIGRLNIDGKFKYVKSKLELELSGSIITTIDSSVVNRENEDISFTSKFLKDSKWYSAVSLRYQRSIELGLLDRWQEGGGIGYKFLQRQHNFARVLSGIVVNQETDFENNENTYFEWSTNASYDFFSFSKPNITIAMSQGIYVSLSQRGRIRNEGDLDINWELIDDFSINISLYHYYDRKSPGTNTSKTDYGFVTGLNYKF